MNAIHGKIIAITGASSGIGEATALLLAEQGAKVALGARRVERLEALHDRIMQAGGEAVSLRTDVTRREDVDGLVRLACERFGKLDVLISNAGVSTISALDELRVEEWVQMVDVHVKGLLYGIAAALPVFRKQGSGHFVNIASTAAHKTVAMQSVYSATKFAVRALSEGLRQEAGDSLRVTVISPGFVKTDFVDSVPNQQLKAQLAQARDRFAMPPEAVARAIAFAIEQPSDIDVGEVIVRPTAQS